MVTYLTDPAIWSCTNKFERLVADTTMTALLLHICQFELGCFAIILESISMSHGIPTSVLYLLYSVEDRSPSYLICNTLLVSCLSYIINAQRILDTKYA